MIYFYYSIIILIIKLIFKESFTFVTNLRYRDLTAKEKEDKVNTLISELGITNCQNTPIGNA